MVRKTAAGEKLGKVLGPENFLLLENIVCKGADNKPFESYPQLFVRKDIERGNNNQPIHHTQRDWITYFEEKERFLPSFALSCNILATLYNRRDDPEINKILLQYKDYGTYYGMHVQNTVVDWGAKKIIHYPQGGGINTHRPNKELSFKRESIKGMPLEDALKNKDFKAYVQNLTGLTQPKTLIDIGEYFGKQAYVWTSSGKDVRAAWLGCYYYFYLDADSDLDSNNAARGVRAEGATQKF